MSVITQPPPLQTTPDAESAPPSQPEASPTLADRLYRFTLDEYHKLADAEILGNARVELIEGLLVTKMTKKTPHLVVTEYLDEVLHRVVPAGWYVSMQNPITIPETGSEPEPDAKVVRGLRSDYEDRRVGPADVGLVVEVSDSSLRADRAMKKSGYARSLIPTYWIVNVPARRIEVYTDPTGPDSAPDYRRREDHASGVEIPLILDGVEVARVAVADLLPRK
jgi:Uma2 family endonuclease